VGVVLDQTSAPVENRAESIDLSSPLGATVVPGGVNFRLFSRNASGVDLLLFDREDDGQPRIRFSYFSNSVRQIKNGVNTSFAYRVCEGRSTLFVRSKSVGEPAGLPSGSPSPAGSFLESRRGSLCSSAEENDPLAIRRPGGTLMMYRWVSGRCSPVPARCGRLLAPPACMRAGGTVLRGTKLRLLKLHTSIYGLHTCAVGRL
jgi:hypothetical protein